VDSGAAVRVREDIRATLQILIASRSLCQVICLAASNQTSEVTQIIAEPCSVGPREVQQQDNLHIPNSAPNNAAAQFRKA
jgi:hypothetical protein